MSFVPMSDRDRQEIRRRVISWVRVQPALRFLSISLLEGPGGNGPDLVFFTRTGGILFYLTQDPGETIPDEYKGWLKQWESAGAPEMRVMAAEGEEDIRNELLMSAPSLIWATGKAVH